MCGEMVAQGLEVFREGVAQAPRQFYAAAAFRQCNRQRLRLFSPVRTRHCTTNIDRQSPNAMSAEQANCRRRRGRRGMPQRRVCSKAINVAGGRERQASRGRRQRQPACCPGSSGAER